jgi:hypothetical protein
MTGSRKRQVIIALILAEVILLTASASLISVGLQQLNKDEDIRYEVSFIEKRSWINDTGYTNTLDYSHVSYQFPKNMIKVFFSFEWKDDITGSTGTRIIRRETYGPDYFLIDIANPVNSSVMFEPSNLRSGTAEHGILRINATVNSIPGIQEIVAPDMDYVLERTSVLNGHGNWTIFIYCEAAGTYRDCISWGEDYGNDWELKIEIHYFEAILTKI